MRIWVELEITESCAFFVHPVRCRRVVSRELRYRTKEQGSIIQQPVYEDGIAGKKHAVCFGITGLHAGSFTFSLAAWPYGVYHSARGRETPKHRASASIRPSNIGRWSLARRISSRIIFSLSLIYQPAIVILHIIFFGRNSRVYCTECANSGS